jgi:general secretion pathway protein L
MPLLDALKPVTAQWTARYRRSPLPAFLSWWKAELVGLLPVPARAWFQDRRETWLVWIEPSALRVQRQASEGELARIALDVPVEDARAELAQLLGGGPVPDRRLVLVLPAEVVLTRHLQFPPAVEPNLRQVLAFEMDRQSPFKADQVYFDYRAEPIAGGRQLQVDLALAPRPVLDGLVERARGLELPLDAADVVSAGTMPHRQGFNLLPDSARARRSNPQLRMNLILAAAALALLVMAMQQAIANRTQALEGLRANVESARAEARTVTGLRNQLDGAVAGAGYLAERKRQAPSVLRVLGDLSERVPDDTWLERMTFREGGLEIAGQSSESTKLIGVLQDSKVLANPAFMGQISPDARTGKERFTLGARYELRPGADLPPAPPPVADPDADRGDADAADADGDTEAGSDSGGERPADDGGRADGTPATIAPGRPARGDDEEAADADAAPAR